ncbi:putative riboflavin biosynthesis protein Rib7 [Pseudovirgaria hyperparasitica]|uniref:2,5-diamino-6-ribosylamino-4(3H)-pyrimidinone 5'-phosphate reductase n=1 Tax=Pseudovirgaria hyperparasitica TaxID=470096 RepID=A0A6A6WGG4_9PEZI|nr:putative riboflavin biosynthesis protein Rib7 [Pseudovirgaria hyperparasitica]KAF2761898.1 putative riboflavin biosynthesis protein Rib7 [Pseudovirgaria hyperparasitica]
MAQASDQTLPKDTLYFPAKDREFLEPHLPQKDGLDSNKCFATLTFATSLDSQLALSPGAPTQLSGPQSKAMTHYLRFRHDAIMIGVGTAVADNPSLNCRLEGAGGYGGSDLIGQPRPVIIDPTARWDFSEKNKIFVLCREGRGKAPYIITGEQNPPAEQKKILEEHGGKFITLGIKTSDIGSHRLDWSELLQTLKAEGLDSVMIEGGGQVINSLLDPVFQPLIDSIIVTIAPTWLGQGGVVVSPSRQVDEHGKPRAAARLKEAKWYPFGEDVVLCGRVKL